MQATEFRIAETQAERDEVMRGWVGDRLRRAVKEKLSSFGFEPTIENRLKLVAGLWREGQMTLEAVTLAADAIEDMDAAAVALAMR